MGRPSSCGPGAVLSTVRVAAQCRRAIDPRTALLAVLSLAGLASALAGTALAQGLDHDLWVTNGTVNAIARSGQTIYIGGDFGHVGPATGNAVPLDAGTGAAAASFPRVAGRVNTVVPDGAGGWYIGGGFTAVDGAPRLRLARVAADLTLTDWDPGANNALDTRTALATDWNPGPTGSTSSFVWALARGGPTLYAGGCFSTVLAWPQSNLAAFSVQEVTGVPPAPGPGVENAVAWPNPFARRVSIALGLAAPAAVRLEVADVSGRRLWRSPIAALGPGRQRLSWDGTLARGGTAPAGLYFLRVRGPGFVVTRPVVRVR